MRARGGTWGSAGVITLPNCDVSAGSTFLCASVLALPLQESGCLNASDCPSGETLSTDKTTQNMQTTRRPDHSRAMGMILGGIAIIQCTLACSDSEPASVGTSPLIVIAISPAAATTTVGESTRFLAQISGASGLSLASCSSSEPTVASVELTTTGCTAVGQSAGTAVVTITAKSGARAAAKLTVVR
jgi:hypothetical protein